MKVELKELTVADGEEVFEMIKEIGLGENGFTTNFPEHNFEDFKMSLPRLVDISRGNDLPEGYVPQTIYWLYVEGKPVAYGKLRRTLNEKLIIYGGHVGYIVRPTERSKGYGKLCDEDNEPSRKVIEANHGIIETIENGICRYWIELYG